MAASSISRHRQQLQLLLRATADMRMNLLVASPASTSASAAGVVRRAFSSSASRSPTGVVMLNMGGPGSLDGAKDGVTAFLTNLFSDREIIPLGPLQDHLGPFIASRRTPKIRAQYAAIGGKSPIGDWTAAQGRHMVELLDKLSPATAPHKFYIAFRYAPPSTEDALLAMKADGVQRAVAFSQYPQFSCTTAGSSFNFLWRECKRLGLDQTIQWSVIDRWATHPGYVEAIAGTVRRALLNQFAPEERDKVVIVFSAHSLPLKVVAKGDQYPPEIAATVSHVVNSLQLFNPYVVAWQSKVGYLPWIGPSTRDVLHGLGKQGRKHVLVVPLGFTSDHIETLYEIGIEYAEDAKAAGISRFERCPALNDDPLLCRAQAEIVAAHLASGHKSTPQYQLKCQGCENPECRNVLNPPQ